MQPYVFFLFYWWIHTTSFSAEDVGANTAQPTAVTVIFWQLVMRSRPSVRIFQLENHWTDYDYIFMGVVPLGTTSKSWFYYRTIRSNKMVDDVSLL
jgi:hypothetical protein